MYLKNKTLTIAALYLHAVRSCHLKDKLFHDTDQFCNFSARLHTIASYSEIKIQINYYLFFKSRLIKSNEISRFILANGRSVFELLCFWDNQERILWPASQLELKFE